jgi:hypothetical protein
MEEPRRITVQQAYAQAKAGSALLVCAYEDEEKFRRWKLEGALSWKEFEARPEAGDKNLIIIFYCA